MNQSARKSANTAEIAGYNDSRARYLDDCLLDKDNYHVYGLCSISTVQKTQLGE